jgi:hypothetical protein
MSQALNELLFAMRQHPAFKELLEAVGAPEITKFSPAKGNSADQFAEHVFRSGARRQHDNWLQFLIGEPTSDKGKS